eukprot:scaffold5479_cov199-Amphora_coffeaeformis.AAC.58
MAATTVSQVVSHTGWEILYSEDSWYGIEPLFCYTLRLCSGKTGENGRTRCVSTQDKSSSAVSPGVDRNIDDVFPQIFVVYTQQQTRSGNFAV